MTEQRVEIIDDDVDVANALADFLELNGYCVKTAHDGASAHALMGEFEPDVALVDLRIGHESGFDVIRWLKRDRPGLTCVIVTAFADVETVVEALRLGAYEYLRKPLHNDEVLAVLQRCFEKRRLELEKEAAEAALVESEGRHRAVLESVIDGIVSIDERGTIQTVNPATERIFGYRSDEMVGRNVTLLMLEPYRSEHDAYLARYMDTAEARIIGIGREVEGRRKNGSVFPLYLAVGEVRREEGRLFIGVISDITRRKRAEEALQRAHDELETRVEERTRELTVEIAERWRIEAALRAAKEAAETANRAKSEFLATMSHELRTPLNAIMGFSEVLKSSSDTLPGEKREEYLDIVLQSGGHLLALIEDILDVSAIEAGKLELNEENVDVAGLVEASVQLVRARAEREQVGLSVSLPQAGLHLYADQKRVKQILFNLLSNAVKFTPESGDVRLSVALADDGALAFEISDTGIGMDEAGIAKAMAMFGQVDGSLAREYEGTGLGLPLTQRLVEAHGATLELDSQLDAGTTATVRFPAHRVVACRNKD
ncbi:MAG: PAS domain S-box protein [Rhodospirillales bacterium]|nr:PAS domain S-box protein [Rhodospirillales bacterium]MDP6882622.1 PAS domain S-box protein [Rhodospirillales bacterium]